MPKKSNRKLYIVIINIIIILELTFYASFTISMLFWAPIYGSSAITISLSAIKPSSIAIFSAIAHAPTWRYFADD